MLPITLYHNLPKIATVSGYLIPFDLTDRFRKLTDEAKIGIFAKNDGIIKL